MMTNNNNSRIAAEMALAEEFKQWVLKRKGRDFSMYPDSETVWLWFAQMRRHTSRLNDDKIIKDRINELYNNFPDDGRPLPLPSQFDKWAREGLSKEFPNPRKGLYIYGPIGTGKTTMARIISEVFQIAMYRSMDIDEGYRKNMTKCHSDFPEVFGMPEVPVIIDDLGTESRGSNFGAEPPIKNVLHRLGEMWESHGKLVIITSNISMKQNADISIDNYYDARIGDRLRQMCEPILFKGPSLRKP